VKELVWGSNGDLAAVLLDVAAPCQDEFDPLRQIRRTRPRVPVIVFSGISSPEAVVEAMRAGASDFLARYTLFLIPVLIAGGFAFMRMYRTQPRFTRIVDAATLKIPIIGMLLRKIAIARFCRTLSTLTSSGVPILDGLEITAKTSGNTIIEDAIMAVRKAVEEGKTLADPLGETKVFPQMVVQMIGVGEQTGALDQMLSKIADFYEDEVDTAVSGMMKLIEPLLISVLGGIIGFIVAAMYLPMYSILQKIG
jgi:type IV pilus assembly protein PilC